MDIYARTCGKVQLRLTAPGPKWCFLIHMEAVAASAFGGKALDLIEVFRDLTTMGRSDSYAFNSAIANRGREIHKAPCRGDKPWDLNSTSRDICDFIAEVKL